MIQMLMMLSIVDCGSAEVRSETAEGAASSARQRRTPDNQTAHDSASTTVQRQPMGYPETFRWQRT